MLIEFVALNRAEIISRCRARVAARMAPTPSDAELEHGVPLFLDYITATLHSKLRGASAGDAPKQDDDMLRRGFTVAQVVHDCVDACDTISELAIERRVTISPDEFKALSACLDETVAEAVAQYGRRRELDLLAESNERATEDLGYLAHELRNLLGTATLAFDALREGSVGISGSTGAMLGRSLQRLTNLVDRSLAAVRLNAGIGTRDRIVISELIEEIEVSAVMEAKARGHQLTIERADLGAVVEADRQILASIIANLMQNAYKYTHPRSQVTLRTASTAGVVLIEVEDECGGLPPDKAVTLFRPFEQRGADRSGLGLGLAICLRGAEAIGGVIRVRDLPGKGCVFGVELPRASNMPVAAS